MKELDRGFEPEWEFPPKISIENQITNEHNKLEKIPRAYSLLAVLSQIFDLAFSQSIKCGGILILFKLAIILFPLNG